MCLSASGRTDPLTLSQPLNGHSLGTPGPSPAPRRVSTEWAEERYGKSVRINNRKALPEHFSLQSITAIKGDKNQRNCFYLHKSTLVPPRKPPPQKITTLSGAQEKLDQRESSQNAPNAVGGFIWGGTESPLCRPVTPACLHLRLRAKHAGLTARHCQKHRTAL